MQVVLTSELEINVVVLESFLKYVCSPTHSEVVYSMLILLPFLNLLIFSFHSILSSLYLLHDGSYLFRLPFLRVCLRIGIIG